jgi:ribose 1,5-bisphosphokinase
MSARLIYVIGPSGSGKDSLLRYAREKLADDPGVVFAHRYITRAADAGGENHVALTPAEFASRQRNRLFALAWHSHGHAYGIGIEINQWLAKGATVIVNGSREYLVEASRHFPELLAVTIAVPTEVLRERLLARGREDASSIEQRLERHRLMQSPSPTGHVINNDGPLERAGEALVSLLRVHAGQPLCA